VAAPQIDGRHRIPDSGKAGEPLVINWDAVKVVWLNGQYKSEEICAMFGISADGMRGRAFRERWNDLKRIKHDKTSVLLSLPEVRLPASPNETVKSRGIPGPAFVPPKCRRTGRANHRQA
jgi:hypothetical protein